MKQHNGTIQTPNYPYNYGKNQHCVWRIVSPYKSGIHLSFESFHLESGSVCDHDYVEVRGGLNTSAPLLGRYCGSTRPPTIYAANGLMQIIFKSDDSQFYSGFKAQFSDFSRPPGRHS